MATSTVSPSRKKSIREAIDEENQKWTDEFYAMLGGEVAGKTPDTQRFREVLEHTSVVFFHLPEERTWENMLEHYESQLRKAEYGRDGIEAIAAAEAVVDEHAQLQDERRRIVETLKEQLRPIESRLAEIDSLNIDADKWRRWLHDNPPRPIVLALRPLMREIGKLERIVMETSTWSPVTDAERALVRYVGDNRYAPECRVDNQVEAQDAVAKVHARLAERLVIRAEAAERAKHLRAKAAKLKELGLVSLWPSEADIQAVLEDLPMPERVQETGGIILASDEIQ